jgi:hypothetical protein
VDVVVGPAVSADASCDDANDVALSGGFYRSHLGIEIFASFPIQVAGNAGWHVAATSVEAPGFAQSIVVCLRVD